MKKYLIALLLIPLLAISCTAANAWTDDFYTKGDITVIQGGNVYAENFEASGNLTANNGATITGNLTAKTGRAASIVIAAYDAPDSVKRQADYVCDGTEDNVEIQQAVDSFTDNYSIHFSTGQFNIALPIFVDYKDGLTLEGEGYGTFIRSIDNANWTVAANGGDAVIDTSGTNYLTIRDMRIQSYSNNAAAECIDGDQSVGMYVEHTWLYVKNAGCAVNFDGETTICSDYTFTHNYVYTNDVGLILMAKNGGINRGGEVSYNHFLRWESDGVGGGDFGLQLGNASYTPTYQGGLLVQGNHFEGTYRFMPVMQMLNAWYDVSCFENTMPSISYALKLTAVCYRTNFQNNNIANCNAGAFSGLGNDSLRIIKDNFGNADSGEPRFASGSLSAGTTGHIAFYWRNNVTSGVEIFITKVVVEVTTVGGTAGSHLDVGIADDSAGTNRGVEIFDDLDLNAQQINDSWNNGDGGQQTKWVWCDDSGSATNSYVVGQIVDANASNLVGKYYIQYTVR